MELPLLKELAERSATAGVVVFRFDWNYYSSDPQKGQPSNGFTKEQEDMQAVLNLAMADARVDPRQIIIAGKSIGSVVAFRVFSQNPSAKALVLLTPLCTSRTNEGPVAVGALEYPRLTSVTKPVVISLGNSDPSCSVPHLYELLKGSTGNIATIVAGGDHGLNVVSDLESPRNAANIAATVQIISHWIKLIIDK
jgi:dienelactone hydrolase